MLARSKGGCGRWKPFQSFCFDTADQQSVEETHSTLRIGMKPFVSAEEEEEEEEEETKVLQGTDQPEHNGREFGSAPFQIPPFRNPSPFSPLLLPLQS